MWNAHDHDVGRHLDPYSYLYPFHTSHTFHPFHTYHTANIDMYGFGSKSVPLTTAFAPTTAYLPHLSLAFQPPGICVMTPASIPALQSPCIPLEGNRSHESSLPPCTALVSPVPLPDWNGLPGQCIALIWSMVDDGWVCADMLHRRLISRRWMAATYRPLAWKYSHYTVSDERDNDTTKSDMTTLRQLSQACRIPTIFFNEAFTTPSERYGPLLATLKLRGLTLDEHACAALITGLSRGLNSLTLEYCEFTSSLGWHQLMHTTPDTSTSTRDPLIRLFRTHWPKLTTLNMSQSYVSELLQRHHWLVPTAQERSCSCGPTPWHPLDIPTVTCTFPYLTSLTLPLGLSSRVTCPLISPSSMPHLSSMTLCVAETDELVMAGPEQGRDCVHADDVCGLIRLTELDHLTLELDLDPDPALNTPNTYQWLQLITHSTAHIHHLEYHVTGGFPAHPLLAQLPARRGLTQSLQTLFITDNTNECDLEEPVNPHVGLIHSVSTSASTSGGLSTGTSSSWAPFAELHSVRLEIATLCAADIIALQLDQIPQLHSLYIETQYQYCTGSFIGSWCSVLPVLTSVALVSCNICDSDVAQLLSRCVNLTELSLQQNHHVTDVSIQHIMTRPLQRLSLQNTKISDLGISWLCFGCPWNECHGVLRWLNLQMCELSSAVISCVARLANLRVLGLGGLPEPELEGHQEPGLHSTQHSFKWNHNRCRHIELSLLGSVELYLMGYPKARASVFPGIHVQVMPW